MNIFKKVRAWLAARIPQADVFAGAGKALALFAWLLLSVTLTGTAVEAFSGYVVVGLLFMFVIVLLITASLFLVQNLIRKAEIGFLTGLTWFAVVSVFATGIDMGPAFAVAVGMIGLGSALIGGGWATYKRRGANWRAIACLVPGFLLVGVWVVAYVMEQWPTEEFDGYPESRLAQLTYPHPAQPGTQTYTVVHYGSGDNPQRPEFGEKVDVKTERVDGSKLIDGWSGRGAWARTSYWDVTADRLPLNGKAWIPDGAGPFPIVLIVHGNHAMEDFSDIGYDYLGELFASHGVITVSVDENFLNSSLGDMLGMPDFGLEEENDARGWLLLKHLELFREWNQTPDHPLAGKGDLQRVVLIGHSRGGEAVSEAAVFNRLSAYPDNALLEFDFNFGIRGVIGIAPVDGQYHPRDDRTRMYDTNYMVIHGSHDGDVTSYTGYATYARATFPGCDGCFKAGYYLLGANHGQFNTSWGDTDAPFPFARWLNKSHLISGEDQREVAKSLFMAFLKTTLFDDHRYREFLATPDRGTSYVPEATVLFNQYQSSAELTIADYLEDDEVTTLSLAGAQASGQSLSLWREAHVKMKWHKTETAAVLLGWQPVADEETGPARYTISLPPGTVGKRDQIVLSLAALPESPGELDDYVAPDTVDFTLALEDSAGETAHIKLSDYKAISKQVEPQVLKLHGLQSERSEVVFHRFPFAVESWLEDNGEIQLNEIVRIALIFDQTSAATIALERVAVSGPPGT